MKRPSPQRSAALLLVLATLAVFLRLGGFEFINYDDLPYVTLNHHVSRGWTWEAFRWAWTTTYQGHWHPLTWLSHMTDVQLFGMEPGGHHLTSLLFHLGSTLLLFQALRRMTGAVWRSAAVAALFALHPLHVETVAWIADRKDVLCGFFWMLTLWCYARYVERPGLLRYALVLVSFALGLASKSMIMTLPAVLLLLDVWPLGRLRAGRLRASGAPAGPWRQAARALALLAEKLPLFASVAAVGALTLWAMMQQFEDAGSVSIGMQARGQALRDVPVLYVTYLIKTFWPTGLALPYPDQPVRLRYALAAEAALLLITVAAVYWQRLRPWLLVGWLWFLGALVPVVGILQSGPHSLADRYTYVPLVGLFLALCWGVPDLLASWRHGRSASVALVGLALGACAILAWVQVGYWRDSGTLFRHSVSVTSGNYEAHNSLGIDLMDERRFDEAIEQFSRSIEADPTYSLPYFNLGQLRIQQRDYQAAIREFRRALAVDPKHPETHTQLGVALQETGDLKNAIEHYRAAVFIEPTADHYYNLGQALHRHGESEEAVDSYRAVLEVDPHHAAALEGLSQWLTNLGSDASAAPGAGQR